MRNIIGRAIVGLVMLTGLPSLALAAAGALDKTFNGLMRISCLRLHQSALLLVSLVLISATGLADTRTASTQPVGAMQIASLGGALTSIYGLDFSVTNTLSTSTGGGGGAGKATLSELHVFRLPDALSPSLFRAAVLGTHLPSVQITSSSGRSGDAQYTLNDATVAGFSTENGVERVSFSYSTIEIQIGAARFCFNVVTNASC